VVRKHNNPPPRVAHRGIARFLGIGQNVFRLSHGHSTPSLKIACKSVQPFTRNLADKETKKETYIYINKETDRKQYPVPDVSEGGERFSGCRLMYSVDVIAGCSSCLNGGTCVDGVNSYTCRCPDKFVGANCQTPLWPCDFQPCLNNGTCSHNATYSSLMQLATMTNASTALNVGFHCHCPLGFTGPRCENLVDWCHGSNVPCQNGGTCRQLGRQFECLCAPGWTGTICDVMNISCAAAARRGEFFFSSLRLINFSYLLISICGSGTDHISSYSSLREIICSAPFTDKIRTAVHYIKPNTHRRRRRDETVESRRVGSVYTPTTRRNCFVASALAV